MLVHNLLAESHNKAVVIIQTVACLWHSIEEMDFTFYPIVALWIDIFSDKNGKISDSKDF